MKTRVDSLTMAPLLVVMLLCYATPLAAQTTIPSSTSDATLECIECHADETPGIYEQWGTSKHYRANVGCFECHAADKGDADAFEHNADIRDRRIDPVESGSCRPSPPSLARTIAMHHVRRLARSLYICFSPRSDAPYWEQYATRWGDSS